MAYRTRHDIRHRQRFAHLFPQHEAFRGCSMSAGSAAHPSRLPIPAPAKLSHGTSKIANPIIPNSLLNPPPESHHRVCYSLSREGP
jgi:hypothetical protein